MGGEHGIRDKGRTATLFVLLFCEPGFKILWAQNTISQRKEQNHLSADFFFFFADMEKNVRKSNALRGRRWSQSLAALWTSALGRHL